MALEREDFAAVVEIAHRFKGAASNVSAVGLAKLLIQAELSGQEQDQDELARIFSDLQSEWDAFIGFARVFAPTTTATKLTPVA
jgi:HPt (histidine-containing phosphotransfer) domain-containing protein